jgi:hypothetical protein
MRSSEHYYAHVQGEQKGPYTFTELKHLFDTGFLPDDALYWQDGMEDWQPVRDLCSVVSRRKKLVRMTTSRSARPFYIVLVVLVLMILGRLLIPPTLDVWRETVQRTFTETAAYWKARDFVRAKLRERDLFVEFAPFGSAVVKLDRATNEAQVTIPCVAAGATGAERMRWNVVMTFQPKVEEWALEDAQQLKEDSR